MGRVPGLKRVAVLGMLYVEEVDMGLFSVGVLEVTRLEELEREIRKLNRAELGDLREWFRKYDSDEWDRQIEEDVIRGGKLDKFGRKALDAHRAGETKEL
ncbi:MAG: hypothetical protein CYG60_07930 [Actinobacteria bacterium]|nr:MAG: hypothetical protein CYG60_07930 [Actinomycetota bacterium]